MHPRLTLNYGLRYEPFIPFDQKGGRHTTWVPGVQSTVVPDAPTGILFPGDPGSAVAPHQQRSQQLRAARSARPGTSAATRRRSSAAATASSTSRSTVKRRTRPKGRGGARRSCARDGLRIRSARSVRPSRRRSHQAGSAARRFRQFPGLRCTQYPVPIRIVYTDQNLRTSYTHHFSVSLQRQLGSKPGRGRRVCRQDRQKTWWVTTTSTRRRSSTRRSPA